MSTKEKKNSDKVYRLKNGSPLSYTLPSRNHPRYPLMWFDEDNNVNRVLRYASNQKSPFEDEQDGNAVLEPIVFEDGMLVVPKTNPVLQLFMHYHPMNGRIFEEVDNEKDAEKELELINNEVEALIKAKEMSIEQIETMTRVLFGKDPSRITTAELKRDIIVFAKNNPEDFLDAMDDPDLQYNGKVMLFFDNKLLSIRNGGREIYFNTPTNKKKMCSVPYGKRPEEFAASWLKSDDGLEALEMLESFL